MGQLLADPVAEARQLIRLAAEQGLVMRALGGVAVFLQSADGQPRLVRSVKDIDLAVAKGSGKAASRVLAQAGYVADEMFNALRGSRRLLYHDPRNGRHVDVFVGEFSMCHELPLTARLGRDPLTVPREELLLSKLQVVELTGNDQLDIYNLLYHHDVGEVRPRLGAVAHLPAEHRAVTGQPGLLWARPGRAEGGDRPAGEPARADRRRAEIPAVADEEPGGRQGPLVRRARTGAAGWGVRRPVSTC
jgi:hypothetical protein